MFTKGEAYAEGSIAFLAAQGTSNSGTTCCSILDGVGGSGDQADSGSMYFYVKLYDGMENGTKHP
jgi:hypothetical protein